MNANDVIIDFLEDNRRRLHRLFNAISDDCVYWKPDQASNSIAVTVWHMGRILDVFLTRQAKGEPAQQECWFKNGWAKQLEYDPRGIGQQGWGMLTGYTLEEVAQIPRLSRAQMLGYLDDVYDTVREYVANTGIEGLLTPAAGFEGQYSQYQCIQMALLDNVRHLGEIVSIKSRWDREPGA